MKTYDMLITQKVSESWWSAYKISNSKKVTILEVFTLVSQSLRHILGNNIASVFRRDWKLKFLLRNSIFGPFRSQNVGPGWFKNG